MILQAAKCEIGPFAVREQVTSHVSTANSNLKLWRAFRLAMMIAAKAMIRLRVFLSACLAGGVIGEMVVQSRRRDRWTWADLL